MAKRDLTGGSGGCVPRKDRASRVVERRRLGGDQQQQRRQLQRRLRRLLRGGCGGDTGSSSGDGCSGGGGGSSGGDCSIGSQDALRFSPMISCWSRCDAGKATLATRLTPARRPFSRMDAILASKGDQSS